MNSYDHKLIGNIPSFSRQWFKFLLSLLTDVDYECDCRNLRPNLLQGVNVPDVVSLMSGCC